MHRSILRHLDSLGFATSVHQMGDYCEVHAVKRLNGAEVFVARAEGKGEADLHCAARAGAHLVRRRFRQVPRSLIVELA